MKRIIDIPEGLYSNIAIDNCSLGEVRTLLGIVAESTPFDSVIEDIKAEINKLDTMTFIGSSGSGCASEMRSECLAIIDRHISGKEN